MKKIIFAACIFILKGCAYDCQESFERIRGEIWNKRIDTLYISKNHATPTMVVSDKNEISKQIGVSELRKMFDNATIGDSIIKDKGSLSFHLKKKDTVLIFYPECNGEQIK